MELKNAERFRIRKLKRNKTSKNEWITKLDTQWYQYGLTSESKVTRWRIHPWFSLMVFSSFLIKDLASLRYDTWNSEKAAFWLRDQNVFTASSRAGWFYFHVAQINACSYLIALIILILITKSDADTLWFHGLENLKNNKHLLSSSHDKAMNKIGGIFVNIVVLMVVPMICCSFTFFSFIPYLMTMHWWQFHSGSFISRIML